MNGHMDDEDEESGRPSSSTLRATPTQQVKRLQQRNSRSPYPKGSPRTPIRRLADEGSISLSVRSNNKSPQSPSMRVLSSIASLLTPFGSRQAKSSAAFGDPEEVEDEDEQDDEEQSPDEEEDKTTVDISGLDESIDTPDPIYPTLPSDPLAARSQASSPPPQEVDHNKPPPRQSLFTSSAFSAPRHSTPSKMGFGALAASAPRPSLPPSAPSFTFGRSSLPAESSTTQLPAYPRLSGRTQLTSPLAKNYDLLARFFAEKAEQEARGQEEVPSSAVSLLGGDTGGEEGGLTEIEVAGCMRLIEESLAQGKSSELERLRGDALERASLGPVTPNYLEESKYNRGYMSRSPSLPLGAAAGEMPVSYGLQSRPSSSFLSPAYHRSDDAGVKRSLASTFDPIPAPAKRRHRPLYLGPGQGASAASSLLRRNQQAQRRSLQNRPALPSRTPVVPSWHRHEVDQEDRDASGSNMKRRRIEDQVGESPPQQSNLLSSRQSLPTPSHDAPPKLPSLPTPSTAPASSPQTISITSRTATADAMLSILSAGPSIPVRRSMPNVNGKTPEQGKSIVNSDVVNPYQTRSRLSKRASVGVGSTSLAAKEKERLKEEREKRQRTMEEAKKKTKESTLEMIERTAPTPGKRRGARRFRVEEEEEEDEQQQISDKEDGMRNKIDEEKRKRQAQAEEAREKRQAEVEQTRKRKESEALEEKKRKLYEQQEQKKIQDEADEERRKKTEEVKKRMEKLNNASAPPVAVSEPATTTTTSSTSSALNVPRKSFGFGSSFAPKKPSPLSQGNIVAPESPSSSSEASERESMKAPIAFASPSINGFRPADTPAKDKPEGNASIPFSFGSTPKEPRQQALDLPSTSLPKFDFTMKVVVSNAITAPDDQSRKVAEQKNAADLPKYDFSKANEQPSASTSSTDSNLTKTSAPTTLTTSTTSSFSFAPSAPKATEAPVKVAAPQQEAISESKSSDNNVSALLSGTGEGEEDEDCLHQVRCKVWHLKEGKWVDLGIGLFKIKKNKNDGKKRILVRNEGNGKVMVNFRLMESFKPIKDKNIVSFLGFDADGTPTNYRCKIKTNEGADDLTASLEREAK